MIGSETAGLLHAQRLEPLELDSNLRAYFFGLGGAIALAAQGPRLFGEGAT